ncbi:MAG: RluA family pseudouridine synthase [Deltaproteobacteria bacterium]|nr:RluA family pseudouridine synthase [Deltaproteobacteria bacterium]MBW2661708.1 RluA family pseudouridine synthase [Deltaproteobacteria bacterium]
MPRGAFTFYVDEHESGSRLDVVAASHISNCSRSFSASLIRKGKILVQGAVKKAGYHVKTGDEISGTISHPEPVLSEPEPIEIDIIYEDKYLIVINKQPGLVVHPAPGHYTGTLVNALLYHCKELDCPLDYPGEKLRPGIVHRLDKDTSGTMVVAKNEVVHNSLAAQFKDRKIKKEYLALVCGEMESESGIISLPVGRHPVERKKMSTISRKGRSAETLWKVKERFKNFTLLEIRLKTGRTHQIRVHCTAIHHPVLGDLVYCKRRRAGKASEAVPDFIKEVPRQMLHAWRLELIHPVTEKIMSFVSPVPDDMENVIKELRKLAH